MCSMDPRRSPHQALADEILLLLVLQRVNALLDCFSCDLIGANFVEIFVGDNVDEKANILRKFKKGSVGRIFESQFDSFVFCTCPPISPLFVSSSAAVSRAHIPVGLVILQL